jgi:hypothetical protein
MNYENPATRLLELLKTAKQLPQNKPTRDTWMTLLNARDQTELWTGLSCANALIQETRAAVSRWHPEGLPSTPHWARQLETAFTKQNLQGDWSSFVGHFDDHTIAYLDITARLLDAHYKTKAATEEERDEYRASLNKMLEEVLASEQPDELKKYLARSLQRIIAALDDYKLTGSAAVIDSVQTMIGDAVLHEELGEQVKKSELAQRVFTSVALIANAMTIASGGLALSGPVMKLLGLGT